MFLDITQKDKVIVDVSFQVADLMYKNANGVLAHDVAMRIYKSEGPVEFSEEEFAFVDGFVKEYMTNIFQDSFSANIEG